MKTVTERHPLGRTCGELLPLAILLMPYALVRHAIDRKRPTGTVGIPHNGSYGVPKTDTEAEADSPSEAGR